MTPKVHRVEKKDAAARIERKLRARAFELKDAAGADPMFGRIEGYAAIFNELHPTSSYQLMWEGGWQDRIMPGAFTETLAELKAAGLAPPMLYMHERGAVIGGYDSVTEDQKGVPVVGQVHKAAQTDNCVPIYDLMKLGSLSGISIGFVTTKYSLDEEQKIREILAVDLREISIVDIPGIDSARVTDVKALPGGIEIAERALRDAGFSRREAKAILAEGFSALRDAGSSADQSQRDAGEDAKNADLLANWASGIAKALHP